MSDEKTEGFWQRIFGGKPAASGCCSMKVEEITEDEAVKTDGKKKGESPKPDSGCEPGSGCCCG
ncbi:MAG: hypothetical protein QUU85_17660 [Candidatus Eisenbacteria bacterium]|nr:hypothetical protein [Candidatus Eisenbacteria bacterium]